MQRVDAFTFLGKCSANIKLGEPYINYFGYRTSASDAVDGSPQRHHDVLNQDNEYLEPETILDISNRLLVAISGSHSHPSITSAYRG
jgi:hypothetical protein